MFYVDLEPKENIKEIYKLQYLNNMKINVEPTNKKKTPFCNALDANSTVTQNPTARDSTYVKCGRSHMITECQQLKKKHLLNLPYARVNILLTTRTVQSTRTYKTQEVNRQSETSELQVDEQPLHILQIRQICSKRCALVLRTRRYYKVKT